MTSNPMGISALPPITLTVKTAMARTGLSRSTLYRMLKRGDITALKAKKRTLILTESLDNFLASCKRWQPISAPCAKPKAA
jgi:excisionase family DNA binding protein